MLPEVGIRVLSTSLIRRLVEAPAQPNIVVPLNWVFDCLAQDQLLNVGSYRLRSVAELDEEATQDTLDQLDTSAPILEEVKASVDNPGPEQEAEVLHNQPMAHGHLPGTDFWPPDLESISTSQKQLLDMLNPPLIPLSIARSEETLPQVQTCDLKGLANASPKQAAFSTARGIDHDTPPISPGAFSDIVMDDPVTPVLPFEVKSVVSEENLASSESFLADDEVDRGASPFRLMENWDADNIASSYTP